MSKKTLKKLEKTAGYNLAVSFLTAKQTATKLFSLGIEREKKLGKVLGIDIYLSLKLNDFFNINIRHKMPYVNKIYEVLNHNSTVIKLKKAGKIASGYLYYIPYNGTEAVVGFSADIPVNWDIINVIASEMFQCNYRADGRVYRAENTVYTTEEMVFYSTSIIINPVSNRIEEGFCLKCGQPHFRVGLDGLCRPCGGTYTYER